MRDDVQISLLDISELGDDGAIARVSFVDWPGWIFFARFSELIAEAGFSRDLTTTDDR